MKIAIFTFHWATNYGAILQAWCLQEYLLEQGYEVEIVNYKPSQFDFSWLYIAKHPSLWKSIKRQISTRKKEALLTPFREKYLNLTQRFSSAKQLSYDLGKYDVLISGSDQVLNTYFTLYGDNGKPSPVYWLGVGTGNPRRVGYAVSFGTEEYPHNASSYALPLVNGFNAIGTREVSGLTILDALGYLGPKEVVPDPTLLLGVEIFKKLMITIPKVHKDYTCVYMLRREIDWGINTRYIDDMHSPLTMEEWLATISNAGQMVTNSYHGMIIAMLAHVPFVVLLELGNVSGMNDRFFTLLERLNIKDRVAKTVDEAKELLKRPIDFELLDKAIINYKNVGVNYIDKCLK